jgi:hypothetical protein
MADLLSAAEARALADRVLKMSTADATHVIITSSRSGNTRFAGSSISTSGQLANTSVVVSVTVGRRRASATTNVLDDASLQRTVDLALRLARLAPEDPELMPPLAPQSYTGVSAFVGRTAGRPAGQIFSAGFLEAEASVMAVANSAGLFAYHRTTDITKALKNFRWNESPLLMLNRLEDIGRSEVTAAGRLMPAVRVSGFDFSSLSDAV